VNWMMREMVTGLTRAAGGLVWLIPVLQCLTYHYGDGTYFRGTVDSTGRPAEGELYTKDQQLRYNGSWRGGLFHGRGVWNEGGHTYTGGFLYGKAAGEGVWVTEKGERIEGHFQNHTVNGKAVWSWPGEGSHMEGSFKRGYAHGPGVLYFSDGSRFEGSFKKGYPNGQGAVKLSNDSVLWEGTFTNGAPDEQVGDGLQTLFTHFHTYPLRMKRSLKWR